MFVEGDHTLGGPNSMVKLFNLVDYVKVNLTLKRTLVLADEAISVCKKPIFACRSSPKFSIFCDNSKKDSLEVDCDFRV